MGLAERIHEDAVVAGQATAKYRSRGVPSDWYVDPADPDAADRYNDTRQGFPAGRGHRLPRGAR